VTNPGLLTKLSFDFSLSGRLFLGDKPIGASPLWQFLGGRKVCIFDRKKGLNAPRDTTDFRENRNPPQADSTIFYCIINILSLHDMCHTMSRYWYNTVFLPY